MAKYRIRENGIGEFEVQRKVLFFWRHTGWNYRNFNSLQEAYDFIKRMQEITASRQWKVVEEVNERV